MYSNILVPVVFEHDPAPDKAIAVARALASKGAKIVLLHVVEAIPPYAEAYLTQEIFERNVRESGERLAKLAEQAGEGVKAEVVQGHAARSILEFAEKHKSDCIVISSHKPGFEDYLIGSTAGRVVRHAPCAVQVLR